MAERPNFLRLLGRAVQRTDEPAKQLMVQYDRNRKRDPAAVQMSRFFEGMASGEEGVPHFSLPFVQSDNPALAALVAGGYEGAKAIAEQGPMARQAVNALTGLLPGATDLRIDDTTSPADLANPLMYLAGHGIGRVPGARERIGGIGRLLARLGGDEDDGVRMASR